MDALREHYLQRHRTRVAPRARPRPWYPDGPASTRSTRGQPGWNRRPNTGDTRPCRGRAFWTVLGVGLVVGLADVAKPVHIDDTLYLTIARWIVGHPLDPYGGTLNWQQFPERTYKVSISPPLLSYAFALVIAVAGENVPLLHLAMVPWVLLAGWALYRLGERCADAGTATALLVLLGPAVVAGMNLMLDVPLLACICAAVECLLRGVERRPARVVSRCGADRCGGRADQVPRAGAGAGVPRRGRVAAAVGAAARGGGARGRAWWPGKW